MRQGYKLVQARQGSKKELKSPADETIAEVVVCLGGYRIQSHLAGVDSDFVRNRGDVPKAVDAIIEAHFKLGHTRWRRLNDFLGEPIWGWLFGFVGLVIAAFSWYFSS